MTPKLPVYLDNHSTTPVDPRVLDAMLPYFREHFGNAASRSHAFGWQAESALEQAREQVAQLIGATSREITFTCGATEGNNLVLQGLARHHKMKGHIVTTQVEHKCVLDTCKNLEKMGLQVTYLPVDEFGRVTADSVKAALRPDTLVVSVMLANNEVGTLNNLAEISKVTRASGVLLHTDAAQAVGRIPVDVNALGVDMLSLSAHKMYGPKGTGALYLRRRDPRVELVPLFFGGGQECGLRSGTVNVPGAVGLGKAAVIAKTEMAEENARLKHLRDKLESGLKTRIKEMHVNGHPTERLPNNLNVSFGFIEGDSLVAGLSEIAVSSTSACLSQANEGSYVLQAMGVPPERRQAAVRFGLGRFTTEGEIEYTVATVSERVLKLQQASPLFQIRPGKN